LSAQSDANDLAYWYELTREMISKGMKNLVFAQAYQAHPKRKTKASVTTTANYVGAIRNAVNKFGSIAKADKEFTKWCEKKLERKGSARDFMVFAKSFGQRSASVAKPKVSHVAVTITWSDGYKRLRAAGFSNAEATKTLNALGITK
jgi:hypothetical protein